MDDRQTRAGKTASRQQVNQSVRQRQRPSSLQEECALRLDQPATIRLVDERAVDERKGRRSGLCLV